MVAITLPEAMLRFRCNERGCCCQGWTIAFTVREASDIANAFGAERRAAILRGAVPLHDRQGGRVIGLDLARGGPDGRCQFLRADSRCEVHAELGEARLPLLCQSFPAFSFDAGDRLVMSWDPVCPEVLERIDEEGPYAVVTVTTVPGTSLHARTSEPRPLPAMRLGATTLAPAGFHALEAQIRALLDDETAPAVDQLGRVSAALARASRGEPPTTPWAPPLSPEALAAFEAHLDACVEAHGARALARYLREYRRFIFALDPGPLDPDALAPHLAFDPAWRSTLDPRSPALQPLLRRYLAHRFFNAFERSPRTGDVAFNTQSVTHTLATALRLAVGLSRHLDRPADRPLLKVALGASEFVFRSLDLPAESMPWFGLDLRAGEEIEHRREGAPGRV